MLISLGATVPPGSDITPDDSEDEDGGRLETTTAAAAQAETSGAQADIPVSTEAPTPSLEPPPPPEQPPQQTPPPGPHTETPVDHSQPEL